MSDVITRKYNGVSVKRRKAVIRPIGNDPGSYLATRVIGDVTITVDMDALFRRLAERAVWSKGGKSGIGQGAIVAKASKRRVDAEWYEDRHGKTTSPSEQAEGK